MDDPGTGPLVAVEDPGDERLADYRDLNDPAARATREGRDAIFVAEGRLAAGALVASGWPLHSLLVDDRQIDHVADLVAAVRRRGAPVYVAPRAVLGATVGFPLHRGVVAIGGRREPRAVAEVLRDASAGCGAPVVCVLEGLNDHENLGALFRNAAAFGVRAVLLDPTCADPLYRRSVRVSLGHVLRIPFARTGPLPAAFGELEAAGFPVFALSPHAGGTPPTGELASWARGRRGRATAVLVGAEGPGLTTGARRGAREVVSIPMAHGVDSLNVATAAAIAFYELSRAGA